MKKIVDVTVNIADKIFQIKCPEDEIDALLSAASYFEDKMSVLSSNNKKLNLERILVIAGLNVTHQFLTLERQSKNQIQTMQNRLLNLNDKIEDALEESKHSQLELVAAE